VHSSVYVEEFHTKFGHPVSTQPNVADSKLRLLRVRLIAEELCELCEALDIRMRIEAVNGEYNVDLVDNGGSTNIVEAADALGDLDYVVQGAMLVFGFPAEAIIKEIHNSNMSKLGEDGKPIYREDGKIVKGPNYWKPDIARVLWPEHFE